MDLADTAYLPFVKYEVFRCKNSILLAFLNYLKIKKMKINPKIGTKP